MNSPTRFACCLIATPLVAWSFPAGAQNIYKCVTAGQVTYTDQPCNDGNGKLLHQASAAETIDHYLRLGQPQLAKAWAMARHLDSLYTARLALFNAAQEAKAKQAQADAIAAQAAADAARAQQQQAMAAAQAAAQAAETDRLAAENTQLRAQNAAYQNSLAQPPVYYMTVPAYFGGWNSGYRPPFNHEHPYRPPPTNLRPPPVRGYTLLQTCGSLKGGRASC
ncbi:MAG: DUF4124 domain-containing protein [Rhodanobacter sp.]|nr:MAG: DUF4124 domain-containing protein [Rhodanobacter sp.]TAM14633.1 MAG: DUF4124 domain-containing protein [Rhodanobacter sp.]TAM37425.1 MAG: DUF4124 domain-containing protein [Rhodanobacter sp.]